MPTAEVNGITTNYDLQGSGNGDLVVLVNGLADDRFTWDAQVSALLDDGFRTLNYDNRGIGKSARPPGPYTAEMMADDLRALLGNIDLGTKKFHLLGISMGGMIAQSYAFKYPNGSSAAGGLETLSLSLCCTYAQPTRFCSRVFELWADMAQRMSVQDVMRDVMLWAFTVPFFSQREPDLMEVETAMRNLDMTVEAYLSQLNVLQKFDSTSALESLKMQGRGMGGLQGRQVMVLAVGVSRRFQPNGDKFPQRA
ncbi:hypothetical protein LTR37_000927 [Vermiconidia calcicola]|uniref:Uncharacterized protein n=1 Tax=Vermiconidia calcicola TaxID=1690605 RepID=A0ACC3NXR6_9PEZI|nr:hypothetical protein LTR37_000927 [Vermiconidia calcicola]